MTKKQKVSILTGVNGMDGSILADKLLAKGHKVIGVDRWNATGDSPNIKTFVDNKDFTMVTGDITEEYFIYRLIKDYQPDYFYNMASISLVPESFKIPKIVFAINSVAVNHMLETIRNHSPHTRFYQASTSEQIGENQEAPQNTESIMRPNSPYAIAKLASYHMVRCYRKAFGLFAVNGMLWNHEGPRRGPMFVTRKITLHIGSGTKEPLQIGNMDSYRDWGLADDYCVPGNTKLLTKSDKKSYHNTSSKQIKDLNIGDFVLTYNIKNGEKEFKKIINTQNRYVDSIYKLELNNNNKLDITGNHPVAIINNGNISWKKVEDLKVGDKMIQKNHFSITRRLKNFTENKTRMTNKIKNKIGEAHKGKILSQETKNKIKDTTNKRYRNKEERMKSSQKDRLNGNYIDGRCNVIGKCMHCTKNLGKLSYYNDIKLCKSCSMREKWKDEEYANNIIKKTLESNRISPNNPEKYLINLIKCNFPNTFKFVGNGKKIINRFCPDFIYEDKNKIIELYGSYWHSKPEVIERDIRRKESYEKAGYELLIIYDNELLDEYNVLSKIENFLFNPDVEIVTITEINKIDKKIQVYNIETEDNHNYFAYGLLIHNCDAMILMMEADEPDDYAVNTGESHSIRELIEEAYRCVNKKIIWKGKGKDEKGYDDATNELLVEVNEKWYRPVEVPYLHGDHSKIKEKLGWEPKTKFKELVKLMIEGDKIDV